MRIITAFFNNHILGGIYIEGFINEPVLGMAGQGRRRVGGSCHPWRDPHAVIVWNVVAICGRGLVQTACDRGLPQVVCQEPPEMAPRE